MSPKATVLLNANMAFLSIQSIDNGGNLVADRSAAQIASYISIMTSVGSVIISLILVRQNRSKNRHSAEEAVGISFDSLNVHCVILTFQYSNLSGDILGYQATFLGRMTHKKRGLETLAILYALPYALLMWSYVFVQFSNMCWC